MRVTPAMAAALANDTATPPPESAVPKPKPPRPDRGVPTYPGGRSGYPAKVTITIEDDESDGGTDGMIDIRTTFDPPITPGSTGTPAQRAALAMLQAVGGQVDGDGHDG